MSTIPATLPQPQATSHAVIPGGTLEALLGADLAAVKAKLRAEAEHVMPAIYKRGTGETEFLEGIGIQVLEWANVRRGKGGRQAVIRGTRGARGEGLGRSHSQQLNPMPKLSRAQKTKQDRAGKQYTSKFRGVHQTFPTRRWEAQFRRNGKPTSLGCFDHEEQAARAYDKMMLWCELHNTAGVKGGITNYDPGEYEQDLEWLRGVTQDDLIEQLRSDGRRQAAHRMLKGKKPGEDSDPGRSGRREGTSEREFSDDMEVEGALVQGSSLAGDEGEEGQGEGEGEGRGAEIEGVGTGTGDAEPELDSAMEASRME